MAIQTWGSLQKSTTDDETIEQAIGRLISDHEADASAHLGAGESLEAHKTAEVIDHPAQSVVIDKTAFGLYDEIATVIGGYGWDPDVGTIYVSGKRTGGFSLFSQTDVYCIETFPWDEVVPYPEKDLLFNFFLTMNGAQYTNGIGKVAFSNDTSEVANDRIEFIKTGTSYYFRIYSGGTKVHEYTLQTGGEFSSYVGIYWDSINEQIVLSLNGTNVSVYETANWHDFISQFGILYGNRSTNTNIEVSISMWKARYQFF